MKALNEYVTAQTLEFLNNHDITTTDELMHIGILTIKRDYKASVTIISDIRNAIHKVHQNEYHHHTELSNRMGKLFLS